MPESEIDFRTLRILLADDHAFIRNVIRGILNSAGVAQIRAAASTDEAQDILRAYGSSIDCIVSDWNMPPQGGLELLREIRLGGIPDVRASVPFIMLTAHASSTVVTAALQLDVSAYIVKPVSAAKLLEAIRKSLTKPMTVKSKRFYNEVNGIDLPETGERAPENVSAWADWVKSGKQAILSTESEFIKRESIKLTQATESDADVLRNVRYKRADRIKPGSILVEDFCDGDGNVLINAGAVLNANIIARLIAMNDGRGEKVRLWVGQRSALSR